MLFRSAMLRPFAGQRIGFLGVTFKPRTDDLRESPTLDVMAALLADGASIKAYDGNLDFGPMLQGQIDYVRHAVPRQAQLMDGLQAMCVASAAELVEASDVVVVSHATDEFRAAIEVRRPGVQIVDLVRLYRTLPDDANYHGIAW